MPRVKVVVDPSVVEPLVVESLVVEPSVLEPSLGAPSMVESLAVEPGVEPAPARRVAVKPVPPKPRYDCAKCPGYCCSYDRIEVKARDVARLARHFGLTVEQAERRFTRLWAPGERILRHKADSVYKSICRFFDTEARRCTVYAARPAVCRQYPNGARCGYYEFLKFERGHQGDDTFIPSA